MTRVLVTGVRGKTGVPLARLLTARGGVEVLGGSSDPASVSQPGVVPTAFSWDDRSTWPVASDGVDAVYLVRPDRPDAPELVEAFLAVTPPAAQVVLLSEQDADHTGPEGWAPRVEDAVRRSARSWTILRPSWFMQVFTDDRFYRDALADDGVLAWPGQGARVAWIDARDIAAVVERALLDDDLDGRVLEITGPDALTLPETASRLSTGLGRTVTHREVDVETALVGLTGFDRELTRLTFERVRAGSFAVATGTVEDVTGRAPRSLEAFAADLASSG